MASGSTRTAQNLINRYGLDKFRLLISKFKSGTPGPAIALEFGVTRQRVNQWKQALGKEHVTFILEAEVEQLVSLTNSLSSRVVL